MRNYKGIVKIMVLLIALVVVVLLLIYTLVRSGKLISPALYQKADLYKPPLQTSPQVTNNDDLDVIEKELEETDLGAYEEDLKQLDDDAASL